MVLILVPPTRRGNDYILRFDPAYVSNVWAFAPKYNEWWENYIEFLTTDALHGRVKLLVQSLRRDLLMAEDLFISGHFNTTKTEGYYNMVKTSRKLINKADRAYFDFRWFVDWDWPTDTFPDPSTGSSSSSSSGSLATTPSSASTSSPVFITDWPPLTELSLLFRNKCRAT